jgi:hypothetical protein
LLRTSLQTLSASSATAKDEPKCELPKVFNWEYSPTYNLLNWVQSMKNYCAQHKCREEDVT